MSETLEISVEQFMDGMKAVLREHGLEDNGRLEAVLVDAYNKYNDELKSGKSIEELTPFFLKVADDVLSKLIKTVCRECGDEIVLWDFHPYFVGNCPTCGVARHQEEVDEVKI